MARARRLTDWIIGSVLVAWLAWLAAYVRTSGGPPADTAALNKLVTDGDLILAALGLGVAVLTRLPYHRQNVAWALGVATACWFIPAILVYALAAGRGLDLEAAVRDTLLIFAGVGVLGMVASWVKPSD